MPQPNQFRPVTDERLAEVRKMLDDNCSLAEIVRTTGMARETIKKYTKAKPWSFQECGSYGVMLKRARKAGLL